MYRIKILTELRTVVIVFSRDVGYEELITSLEEVFNHPGYSADFNGIADLRQVVEGLSLDETANLATFVESNHLSTGRWALLASSPVTTALAMVYEQAVVNQHQAQVFSTVEAVSTYLRIDLRRELDP